MLNKILVPFENVEPLERVLPYAASFATQFEAELILLRILPSFRADLVSSRRSLRAAKEIATEIGLERLGKITEPTQKMGIKVKILVIEGHFQEEIEKFSKASGIDLIVLSAPKPSRCFNNLFKSISDREIYKSQIPLIIVPDEANSMKKDFDLGIPVTGESELCPSCFSKERFEEISLWYHEILDGSTIKNNATITHCTNCE